jgi:hypothetical protein
MYKSMYFLSNTTSQSLLQLALLLNGVKWLKFVDMVKPFGFTPEATITLKILNFFGITITLIILSVKSYQDFQTEISPHMTTFGFFLLAAQEVVFTFVVGSYIYSVSFFDKTMQRKLKAMRAIATDSHIKAIVQKFRRLKIFLIILIVAILIVESSSAIIYFTRLYNKSTSTKQNDSFMEAFNFIHVVLQVVIVYSFGFMVRYQLVFLEDMRYQTFQDKV